ncbi:hypothetical protein Taro_032494 [Colocasia esculenta]|uniref:Uncharacterized protein n=1 Tax=Colocasia esculenta TaxID=4460 RepID=A0A843W230_COLES|nr:hypothetical protein [Colocasia esculenta]
MFETAIMEGDNTTFTFAELGLPSEQYPPASVEAYVPMPVGEFPVGRLVPEGGLNFINQSPFPEPQAYSAFQMGDTTGNDEGLPQMEYNPETSALLMDVGEGNTPHLDNSGSSPMELDAFPGHGVEWPTGIQPTSLPLGDDFLG